MQKRDEGLELDRMRRKGEALATQLELAQKESHRLYEKWLLQAVENSGLRDHLRSLEQMQTRLYGELTRCKRKLEATETELEDLHAKDLSAFRDSAPRSLGATGPGRRNTGKDTKG